MPRHSSPELPAGSACAQQYQSRITTPRASSAPVPSVRRNPGWGGTGQLLAARRILKHVNAQLEVPLADDEAVPITLHLVNAGFATGDLSYTYQMTGVFAQLFDVLEQAYGRPFDRDTVNAARFITHLRYFFVRANSGKQLEESASKLREAIRGSYPDAYSTALKLQAVLELRLGEPLTEDEVTYLTLHVARMVDEDRS